MQDFELKRHPETGVLVPEKWIPIERYDRWYDVSTYGRVRSWKDNGWGRLEEPRLFKTPKNNSGYKSVSLSDRGDSTTHLIHRLVAQTFVPNPEDKPEVNHKDGDKENNFYLNLEWCTKLENESHCSESGLRNPVRGEKHPDARLTEEDVLEIRELYGTGDYYQREIGKMFGVSARHISSIVTRKKWKHI